MGILVEEWHRFAKCKNLYKRKGLGRIGEGEQCLHSGGYNPTSSHHAYLYSPHQTPTSRTSHSPIFNLICKKHENRKRKRKKKSLYYTKGGTKEIKKWSLWPAAQRHPGTPPRWSGEGSPEKGNFQKLSLFRLRTYQKLESGSMALKEKDHLDHAHAPDQPHSCKDHFGNHEEARKPCVFKPHRDATSVTGGSGEERKDQDGRWYVN